MKKISLKVLFMFLAGAVMFTSCRDTELDAEELSGKIKLNPFEISNQETNEGNAASGGEGSSLLTQDLSVAIDELTYGARSKVTGVVVEQVFDVANPAFIYLEGLDLGMNEFYASTTSHIEEVDDDGKLDGIAIGNTYPANMSALTGEITPLEFVKHKRKEVKSYCEFVSKPGIEYLVEFQSGFTVDMPMVAKQGAKGFTIEFPKDYEPAQFYTALVTVTLSTGEVISSTVDAQNEGLPFVWVFLSNEFVTDDMTIAINIKIYARGQEAVLNEFDIPSDHPQMKVKEGIDDYVQVRIKENSFTAKSIYGQFTFGWGENNNVLDLGDE